MSSQSDFEAVSPGCEPWILLDSENFTDIEVVHSSPDKSRHSTCVTSSGDVVTSAGEEPIVVSVYSPVNSHNLSETNSISCDADSLACSHEDFLRASRDGDLSRVLDSIGKLQGRLHVCNENGLNALHLASKAGHVNVVKELLTRGFQVNRPTKKGNVALHKASFSGHVAIVEMLLDSGADVNAQNQHGHTPLHVAVLGNHADVVKILLSKNANPSLINEDGYTPLALAIQQGYDEIVALLLNHESLGGAYLSSASKLANLRLSGDKSIADSISHGSSTSPPTSFMEPLPALKLSPILSTSPKTTFDTIDLTLTLPERSVKAACVESSSPGSTPPSRSPPSSALSTSPFSATGKFLKSMVVHSTCTLDDFGSMAMASAECPFASNQQTSRSDSPSVIADHEPSQKPNPSLSSPSSAWDSERFLSFVRPKPVPKSVTESTYNIR